MRIEFYRQIWGKNELDAMGSQELPCPPRIARAEAAGRIPPALLSFMSESRRLDNRRMKHELGVRLRYPTVRDGLVHAHAVGAH